MSAAGKTRRSLRRMEKAKADAMSVQANLSEAEEHLEEIGFGAGAPCRLAIVEARDEMRAAVRRIDHARSLVEGAVIAFEERNRG